MQRPTRYRPVLLISALTIVAACADAPTLADPPQAETAGLQISANVSGTPATIKVSGAQR